MKKLLLILILWLIQQHAHAQITLTSADFPVVGGVWVELSDQSPGPLMTVTAASASAQTWNYANAFGVTDTFAFNWKLPSQCSGHANYPSATIGAEIANVGAQSAEFFEAKADGLYFDGLYENISGFATILFSSTDYLSMPVPFTYSNSRTVMSRQVVTSVYDTSFHSPASKTVSTQTLYILCDAWGTLTTPAISNVQVLRIKTRVIASVDSNFTDTTGMGNSFTFDSVTTSGASSEIDYQFYKKGSDAPVMYISYDSLLQSATQAAYFNNSLPFGITENGKPEKFFTLFPNPASGRLNIQFTANLNAPCDLTIMNVMGAKVYEATLDHAPKASLDISRLPAGIYMVMVRSGEKVFTEKVVVE